MKNNHKHIVFLTPGFAESEKDSITIPALQVFLKSLRKALPKAKLTLLAFQFPFTKKAYLWHGIKVIPLNGQNKRLHKLWTWNNALKTIQELHKTQKIDTLHSFWIGECSQIGERFSKKHSINHIVTVMGQDARLKNKYTKTLLDSKAQVITLSKNHAAILLNNHNLNSVIIPWQLDVSEFPELKEHKIDILGVGSLNNIKNYSEFIDIISDLKKTHKHLKAALIGDGLLKQDLVEKIQNLGLQDTIKLYGKLPRPAVFNKMAQSKILLHTSKYESFGFVFLEALYSGMQISSYNVGLATPSEDWKIGNNKTALLEACKRLLSNPKKEKKRIVVPLKLETTDRYIKLYHA